MIDVNLGTTSRSWCDSRNGTDQVKARLRRAGSNPMIGLPQAVPDSDVLLAMEPEELGAKLLFLLRKQANRAPFILSNFILELWPYNLLPGQSFFYPAARKDEINLALAEAWSWLIAQGLLVSAPNAASTPAYLLSRRAGKFADETEFRRFAAARMLQKETLHPRIATDVWIEFMRGKFDIAVLLAMKAVEVVVRESSGLPSNLVGVKLMREAFRPHTGPLADQTAEGGEQEARSALFAGAIGSYKNSQAHRDVNLDDPVEALEIVMLANHLLRIVDSREKSKSATATL
jgi:uncharacterized protein (TIGR02391 family)